ncbi:phosphatase PAP2 family protein [Streptomyces sp. NBC_00083]|uniref:phosphatase PAP2 family protein n=1 Tax=Streptomyces sp. NBC_00083 TaxID=2975647 RepID=UPI002256E8F8|nr:phosphatase PAP2 family protein [Streptomyces sp. NBC_00083]MCX5387336.1 phosphatase PAP2 family protein [Streptomyces sp. NBC_00083]
MIRPLAGGPPGWPMWFGWWTAAHAGLLLVLVTFGWDQRLSGALCSWTAGRTSLVRWLEVLTSWGNPWPVTLVAAGSACFALIRRNVTAAVVLLVVPYAATVSCDLVKGWAERPRPSLPCASVQAAGFSFPSGHAVGVTTGFLLAALYVGSRTPPAVSALILALTGLCAELVSWSRVLLGVHFGVDVLTGQLLGAGWLAVAVLHRRPGPLSRRGTRPSLPDSADEPVP